MGNYNPRHWCDRSVPGYVILIYYFLDKQEIAWHRSILLPQVEKAKESPCKSFRNKKTIHLMELALGVHPTIYSVALFAL